MMTDLVEPAKSQFEGTKFGSSTRVRQTRVGDNLSRFPLVSRSRADDVLPLFSFRKPLAASELLMVELCTSARRPTQHLEGRRLHLLRYPSRPLGLSQQRAVPGTCRLHNEPRNDRYDHDLQHEDARDRKAVKLLKSMSPCLDLARVLQNLCDLTITT